MNIDVKTVANFLGEKYIGANISLSNITSLSNLQDGSIAFCKTTSLPEIQKKCLILLPYGFSEDIKSDSSFSIIKVKNPRLSFAKVANKFFVSKNNNSISVSSKIGKNCSIGENVSIGEYCTIGDNVKIGNNTKINNLVVIGNNTVIGNNCYIKSGSVIGEDGFGFDFEDDRTPVRIPHIGNVIIENCVEIGAKNSIAKATFDSTIIKDGVKTDDQVHIGHNCNIGKNTIITACAEISGSVNIGENCWIGPNTSIIQKIKIGKNVTIGIGTIVTNDIEDNKKVMCLHGLGLRDLAKFKKDAKYGK